MSEMNKPSIRRTQIITTFGPGALVNLVQGSYIGMGIDHWPRDQRFEDRVYDDRLQKRLGKKFFLQPPSNEGSEVGLPYRRFPRWFFCPHPDCRKLQPFEEWDKRSQRDNYYKPLVCPDHRVPLVPMNFLVVCLKGHIDDFPWPEWVHRSGSKCSNRSQLLYVKGYSGVGLGGVVIRCPKCNAVRSMRGSFSDDAFGQLRCSGSKPWTGQASGPHCGERLKTVQRGGSNVYFPKIVSSIAIPSTFNDMIEEMKRTDGWMALSSLSSVDPALLSKETVQKIVDQISKDTGIPVERVTEFVDQYGLGEETKEDITEEHYRYDEYAAFHTRQGGSGTRSRDFRVEDATQGFDYGEFGIESVLMVKAIREVRALVGFTRLKPLEVDEELEGGSSNERPHLVDLSEKPLNWLPAVEVRGEGIFLTFNGRKLDQWSCLKEVQDRMSLLNSHLKRSCESRAQTFSPVSPKQVFLHTFAHLLIRQLSFECGYASASLRERVYSASSTQRKMQGILIYTAAGDADGTLGGLVRQAKCDKLPGMIRAALSNAAWCSNDPLCVESKGQGFDSLNLAACYACCLLPETSCESFNKLLDRAMVVGTLEAPSIGFLAELAR